MIKITPEQEFFWQMRYPMSFVHVIGCVKIVGTKGYEYEGQLYGFIHAYPDTTHYILSAGNAYLNLYVQDFVLDYIDCYDVENNILLDINEISVFSKDTSIKTLESRQVVGNATNVAPKMKFVSNIIRLIKKHIL